MKSFSTTAIAALVAGTMGALLLTPAFADDAAATPASQNGTAMQRPGMHGAGQQQGMRGMWMHRDDKGMGPHGELLKLACSERGGEAIEMALVHLKYSVDPTADQTPLFNALHDAAVADQKTFAEACKSAMGDKTAAGTKSVLDRLQAGLDIEKAKLAAMTDLLPKFKTFYDSLTDAQKAKLNADRGALARNGMRPWADRGGMHRDQPGRDSGRSAAPDDTAAPADDTISPT